MDIAETRRHRRPRAPTGEVPPHDGGPRGRRPPAAPGRHEPLDHVDAAVVGSLRSGQQRRHLAVPPHDHGPGCRDRRRFVDDPGVQQSELAVDVGHGATPRGGHVRRQVQEGGTTLVVPPRRPPLERAAVGGDADDAERRTGGVHRQRQRVGHVGIGHGGHVQRPGRLAQQVGHPGPGPGRLGPVEQRPGARIEPGGQATGVDGGDPLDERVGLALPAGRRIDRCRRLGAGRHPGDGGEHQPGRCQDHDVPPRPRCTHHHDLRSTVIRSASSP